MSELALAAGTTRIDTGALPTDWKAMQLRDFCSFVQGGRLGLTKQDHYRSSGVPAFSAAGQDGYVDVVEFRDTDAVILSAIGANCGRCFLATGNWTTLANVQVIIPRPSDAIAPFLHYRVNRDDYWPRSGSAQPFIKPSDIRSCWVALPPVPQQAAIAKVLDTLDTAIQETEAIIAKLKAVKQGLLHDLLTRGIDANGELRPPQSEAPHLYKPSPLGWIPKEWDYGRLAERLGVFGGKRLPAGHAYADRPTAFKYLRVTDFFERDYRLDELENLHERTFKALERYEIRSGQLFISIAGSLGYVGVHRADESEGVRTILTENAARLVPLCELVPEFVAAYMNSNRVQSQVTAEKGTGGGVPKLALFRIEQFWLAWPDKNEQEQIAMRIRAVNDRVQRDVQSLQKLRLEKAGLMDDLLTGRVRVTSLLQEAQHA
jgi:type I restriction enzyme S subunit